MSLFKKIAVIFMLIAVNGWSYDIRIAEPYPSAEIPRKVVIGVGHGDDVSIHQALRAADDALKFYEDKKVHIRIVAYHQGMRLLLKKEKAIAERVQALQQRGVEFVACGYTMDADKIEDWSLTENVEVVSAGVAEIIERVQEGAVYFQP
ncbi:MAG: DsrE family protein [Campylobacterales bacterium]|nr:DsrE family protein [Campylobacterales bacterium]